MGACSKINAISLNVKINKRKSVEVCGYKLPINVLNFMQKDSTRAKMSLKVVGGLFFFTHPVYMVAVLVLIIRPPVRSNGRSYKMLVMFSFF